MAIVFYSCQNKEARYGDVTLPSTTKILRSDILKSKLISIDSSGTIMTFRTGNKIINHLKPGDVLVAEWGTGLVRRVIGIIKKDGQIIVSTTKAGLADAVKDGKISLDQTLTEAMILSVQPKSPGITVKPIPVKPGGKAGEIAFEYTISETTDNVETIVFRGIFSLSPSIRVRADIQGHRLVKYRADYSVEISMNNTVDAFVTGLSQSFSGEVEVTFTQVTVMIGPVPVIIQPRITVETGVEPGQTAEDPDQANQPARYTSWAEYDPENKWRTGEGSPADTVNGSTADLNANPFVIPSESGGIELYFYGELYYSLSDEGNKNLTAGRNDSEIQGISQATITDPRDGRKYGYKNFDTQTWLVENMAWLPTVSGSGSGSEKLKRYYVSGYEGTVTSTAKKQANYINYGVLYNWPAAKTACPPGWHLPGDDEWKVLEKHLGMNETDLNNTVWRNSGKIGNKLKASGTNQWTSSNPEVKNTDGFTAIPGGCRGLTGNFNGLGNDAYYWSASRSDGINSWTRVLSNNQGGINRHDTNRGYGFSVRCVKNKGKG